MSQYRSIFQSFTAQHIKQSGCASTDGTVSGTTDQAAHHQLQDENHVTVFQYYIFYLESQDVLGWKGH